MQEDNCQLEQLMFRVYASDLRDRSSILYIADKGQSFAIQFPGKDDIEFPRHP